jgi:hypothetical protein
MLLQLAGHCTAKYDGGIPTMDRDTLQALIRIIQLSRPRTVQEKMDWQLVRAWMNEIEQDLDGLMALRAIVPRVNDRESRSTAPRRKKKI